MCEYTASKYPSGNGSGLLISKVRGFIGSFFPLLFYQVSQQQWQNSLALLLQFHSMQKTLYLSMARSQLQYFLCIVHFHMIKTKQGKVARLISKESAV
jgi:hypothetical protein